MQLKRNAPVKIAVAEDEPDIRKTFVWLLERLGHEVVCAAENGEELLDKCKLGKVDLVFVDLDMPVMDGYMALDAIRKQDAAIPVLAFTAAVLPNMKEDLMARGFNDMLHKPFRPEDLHKKVAMYAGRSKAKRQD